MAVKLNGRGTACSTPWGSPSSLVKAKDGETGYGKGNPIYDGSIPEGPHRSRCLRFGTWNVGSMTGRSAEVVDVLMRRRVDVCCVQETRWKGGSARMINGDGGRYKFFWQWCPEGISGVGVLLSEEIMEMVVDVKRVNERLMLVKLVLGSRLMNVISGYAPQVGRSDEEKSDFWDLVDGLVQGLAEE